MTLKEGSSKDNRTYDRIADSRPVSCIIMGDFVNRPNMVDIYGKIMDVSHGGMRIRIDNQSIKTGMILRIRVPIAATSFALATVPVLVQVKWVKPAVPEDCCVGARFIT